MDGADRYRRRNMWMQGSERRPAIERFLAPSEKPQLVYSMESGIKAGVVGGLMMAVMLALSYSSEGGNPAFPASLLVYGLTGDSALAQSIVGIVFGIIIHLAAAAGLGAVFGFIMAEFIGKMSTLGAAAAGGIYGLLVWIIGQYVVLDSTSFSTLQLFNQSTLALSHLVFGFCLGLFGSAYHFSRRARHHR